MLVFQKPSGVNWHGGWTKEINNMGDSILAYSKLYRSFISIERNNYSKVIHFFQENEEGIRELNDREFNEIMLDFCDALFEAGQYQRYIKFSLEILPISLEYGVPDHLYSKILFRRAASFYNIGLTSSAESILIQLYRISPDKKEVKLLLKKCIKTKRTGFVQKIRAIAILFILLTALISSIEVLFIRPFYEPYLSTFEMTRYILIISAMAIVIFGLLMEQLSIKEQIEKINFKNKKID